MLNYMAENKRILNLHKQKLAELAIFQANTTIFEANTNAFLKTWRRKPSKSVQGCIP